MSTQVDYIKSLNTIIKTTLLSTWKAYLKWSSICWAAKIAKYVALLDENFDLQQNFMVLKNKTTLRRESSNC
jgi:predicted metalloendopeptidase